MCGIFCIDPGPNEVPELRNKYGRHIAKLTLGDVRAVKKKNKKSFQGVLLNVIKAVEVARVAKRFHIYIYIYMNNRLESFRTRIRTCEQGSRRVRVSRYSNEVRNVI